MLICSSKYTCARRSTVSSLCAASNWITTTCHKMQVTAFLSWVSCSASGWLLWWLIDWAGFKTKKLDVFYHQNNSIPDYTTRATPCMRGGRVWTGNQTIASPMPWQPGHDILSKTNALEPSGENEDLHCWEVVSKRCQATTDVIDVTMSRKIIYPKRMLNTLKPDINCAQQRDSKSVEQQETSWKLQHICHD